MPVRNRVIHEARADETAEQREARLRQLEADAGAEDTDPATPPTETPAPTEDAPPAEGVGQDNESPAGDKSESEKQEPAQEEKAQGRLKFHFPEHEKVYRACQALGQAYYRRDVALIKKAKEELTKAEAEFKVALVKQMDF